MKKVGLKPRIGYLSVIFLVLFISFSSATGDPIGYEYLTSENHLHTWNQNPLGVNESNIWFNASSGYLQFFNGEDKWEALERSKWLTHRFGLAYYNAQGFNLYSKNKLGEVTSEVYSDNATMWKQLLYDCKSIAGREFCAGWKRKQLLTSTHMENSFYFRVNNTQPPFTFNKPIWYSWGFENISIENDDTYDKVIYCNMTSIDRSVPVWVERCDEYRADSQETFEIDNLTYLNIQDSNTKVGHELIWENTTFIRLRHEPDNPMLLAKINNGEPLIDWRGIDSTKMWWIDLTSDTAPDTTNEVTGWINKTAGIGIKSTAVNNTPPLIGYRRLSPFTQKRGVQTFNVSSLPKYINISSVNLFHSEASHTSGPFNWKIQIFTTGDGSVASDGYDGGNVGLDNSTDWDDGNSTNVVDFDADGYCGGNFPCDFWIKLGKSAETDINQTIQQELDWFTIRIIDVSQHDFTSPTSWEYQMQIVARLKSLIKTNYTLLNGTMTNVFNAPSNNTDYEMSGSQIQVNLSVDTTGTFDMDHCGFNMNGTYFINTTTQQNGTISQNFTIDEIADNYTWNVYCVDDRGLNVSTTGSYWFNVSEVVVEEEIIGVAEVDDGFVGSILLSYLGAGMFLLIFGVKLDDEHKWYKIFISYMGVMIIWAMLFFISTLTNLFGGILLTTGMITMAWTVVVLITALLYWFIYKVFVGF